MPEITIKTFDTLELLEALHINKPPQTALLSYYTEKEPTMQETIMIDISNEQRRMAKFVAPDHEALITEKEKTDARRYGFPLIQERTVTDAIDILNRSIGQNHFERKTPQQRAAEEMGRDMALLQNRIIRRKEWMAAQQLLTGKIPIVGQGYNTEIDMSMKPEHKVVLTGNDLWSDADSDPIKDIEAWALQIRKATGRTQLEIICSLGVWQALREHAKVQNLLDNRRIVIGNMINDKPLEENGKRYEGDLVGYPIYTYQEWYLDDAGVERQIIPDNMLLMIAKDARAELHYGPVKDLSFSGYAAEKWFPKTWREDYPSRDHLVVMTACLPIFHEVDGYLNAQVLA